MSRIDRYSIQGESALVIGKEESSALPLSLLPFLPHPFTQSCKPSRFSVSSFSLAGLAGLARFMRGWQFSLAADGQRQSRHREAISASSIMAVLWRWKSKTEQATNGFFGAGRRSSSLPSKTCCHQASSANKLKGRLLQIHTTRQSVSTVRSPSTHMKK